MRAPAWTVAVALCLPALLVGCKEKKSSGGGVTISASKTAVVANGVNTVTLNVTDSAGGPVSVTTSRGTFSGGLGTATVQGGSGTLVLTTCNTAVDSTCAGTAVVTATHSDSTASVSITFGTLATACQADCTADAGCATRTCTLSTGGAGTCSSTTPSVCGAAVACTPNPAGATTETSCSDGIDNDCNGTIDCADAACANLPCQAGSPTSLCVSGTCTETTSGLAIEVTPARTRLPANGTATTTVAVKVTGGAQVAASMGVSLSTDLGTLSAATGTTGADGIATFTLTSSTTPGIATLTASVTAAPAVTRTATVTFPALGSLAIPSKSPVQYPVQGVMSSGWQEFGYVSALALDDQGQPYPDGLEIRFEHRRLGGSTLGAPLAADTATCLATAGCVGHLSATTSGTGTPDTVGLATAWLYSGTVAGTLVTTASTTVGGVTRTITLPTVAVVGARANGANFSMVCTPRNVPALAETDCAISLVDAPFTCEALLEDRFGNVLGTATQVTFVSEAGAVGQVTSTPAYDPAQTSSPDLGIATQIFRTLGAGLPFDVAPQTGEPSVDLGAPDICGVRVHNPRDGVVTIIAIADGEEAFFDTNGNGVYDPGEPFIDQGEPFVDANDNGVWDAGEWFLDVNGDGKYNLPNGVWDGATKIWTQTVVVYTGQPATLLSGTSFLGTRWGPAAGSFPGACTPTAPPTLFSVHPSQAGPPVVPPSSETWAVYASDVNLNRLDAGTQYSTAVEAGAITVKYNGLASYADDLGFFYRYWPCDQTGLCASQCRSTGTALPCVMTPTITSYGCGIASSATITGGATSDPAPAVDLVDWKIATPYSVYLGSRTSLFKAVLGGVNQ